MSTTEHRLWSSEEMIFKDAVEDPRMVVVIPIFIIIGSFCVAGNILVWQFYLNKRDNLMHFLYFLLATSDILSGLSALLHAVVWIFFVTENKDAGDYTIVGAFLVSGVSARVSAWLGLLLSLTRTLVILLPTNRLMLKRTVSILTLLITITWTSLAIFDIYIILPMREYFSYLVYYQYLLFVPAVGQGLFDYLFYSEIHMDLTSTHYLITWIMIPFAVPSFLVLISSVIQITRLHRHSTRIAPRNNVNQRITGTVLRLTLIFTLFNTPSFILLSVYYWNHHALGSSVIIPYTCSTLFPLLSSSLNPCVLIVRGSGLREFAKYRCEGVLVYFGVRKRRGEGERSEERGKGGGGGLSWKHDTRDGGLMMNAIPTSLTSLDRNVVCQFFKKKKKSDQVSQEEKQSNETE